MTLLLSLPNPAANAAGPFAWSLLLAAAVVVKPALNGRHGVDDALLKFVDRAGERSDEVGNHRVVWNSEVRKWG